MKKATNYCNRTVKLEYNFRSDVLFKMLFVRYPHLLKRLIAAILNISVDMIEEFHIMNTEMTPEEIGRKFCRLDISMVVNGVQINIEIQNTNEGDFIDRTIFNWSRLFSSSLQSGVDYAQLKKTIVICIVNFELFKENGVHSHFQLLEINRHTLLSDKMVLHYFELPKAPNLTELDYNNELELWLALFNASTQTELDKLATDGGEIMQKAIHAYESITATDEFKELEWARRKAEHDEATALANERRKVEAQWAEAVTEKEAQITEKDSQIATLKAEKEAQIAEKDSQIAEKDSQIAELMRKLEEKNN